MSATIITSNIIVNITPLKQHLKTEMFFLLLKLLGISKLIRQHTNMKHHQLLWDSTHTEKYFERFHKRILTCYTSKL